VARRSRGFQQAAALGATLALFSCGGHTGTDASAASGKTHTVAMDGTSFRPPSLTVSLGDSVVWINKDPFPHTATSQSGGFDSSAVAPDKSWRFTPTKKGEFAYTCTLHPTMKGALKVE
jgi:plastocyanin